MDLAIPIGTVNPRLQITKAIWSILHSGGQKTSRFSCSSTKDSVRTNYHLRLRYRQVQADDLSLVCGSGDVIDI